MKRNLLLTPGPTQLPIEVCAALSRPIIHHRTTQYQDNLRVAVEGLKYVFQTRHDVFILTSSGTGGMEASVVNFLSPGDKVITVESGKFGERWTEICKANGIHPRVISVKWGQAVGPHQVRETLDEEKDIKAVFVTLCETSTGVTTNIKALGEVVRGTGALLVVDAVSGLGVTDLQMDNWGVDVAVAASHKGLMLPPGLAFVAVGAKALALMEKAASPRYYFDLRKAKKAAEKTDTPFTSAIGLVIALNEGLRLIKERGLDRQLSHCARLARATREAVTAMGLKLFPHPQALSNVVTAVCVPKGVDGAKLVKVMRDEHGITMAGGQEELKGKIFRIAHMGCLDEYDILTGISCLEKVLHTMGYPFSLGAGVAAAQKVLNVEENVVTGVSR